MGVAKITISLTVLRDLLHLPETISLKRVRQSWEAEREGSFEVLVEDEKFPEIPLGRTIPWAGCEIRHEPCACGEQHIVKGKIIF